VACSSLDFATNDTKPPKPGVVLDIGRSPSKSESVGERSSVKVPPSGDMIAEAGVGACVSEGGSVF